VSDELEKARQQLSKGNRKKAVETLWRVEAKARGDFAEAQGLVEVAKQLSAASESRVRKDAELLLAYGEEYIAKLSGQAEAFGDAIVPIQTFTFVGGHGYPLEVRKPYQLVFTADSLRIVELRRLVVAEEPLADVDEVSITGSARRTSGGFFGGGFGATGAVEGMAIASVLNALSARTDINTVVRIQTRTGELFFHSGSIAPEGLRMEFSPIFTRLRGRERQQDDRNGDTIERLSKLADLLDRGAITADEFARLKSELLS
jgi:hypothetical protein